MQTRLNPYLGFRDNAREAMQFYHSVFGGRLTSNTFAEFRASQDPAEQDKIMHSMPRSRPARRRLLRRELPYLGVALPDAGDRVALVDLCPGHVPARWLVAPLEHPCGLSRRAVRDVLPRRRNRDGPAEHGGREPAYGLGSGTAADEDHPVDARATRDERIESVGQAAQETFDRRAREVGRGRRAQPQAVHGAGRIGAVGRALAF